MTLKSQIYKLLDDNIYVSGNYPEAKHLTECLQEMRDRLDAPLRIAIAGIMKAGKSTFLNALLGEKLVFTGNLETTYTVCWFKYGKIPSIRIHYRDGRTEDVSFDELEKWSVRTTKSGNVHLNDVKYLVVYYPNEVLKTFEFIDTPGLNSVYGIDAQNTMDYLAIRSSKESADETSSADAVIYAFSRSTGNFDEEILNAFQRGANSASTPLNSVGILTQPDATGIWNIDREESAVESANPVAESIMKHAEMRRLLYTIMPVCAKPVEGFASLTEKDWDILIALSELSSDERIDLLYDESFFVANSDNEHFGNDDERKHLVEQLRQYGIVAVCSLISEGVPKEKMADKLSRICGITQAKERILAHFGNRTFLIKTHFIFGRLLTVTDQMKKDYSENSNIVRICTALENNIDELSSNVQTLNELRILQAYYNGQLNFTDDECEDFLQITGEYGREPENKLGISGYVSARKMMKIAEEKSKKWHEKASSFMKPAVYIDAASTIARSYEFMYHYLSALCEE